MGPACPLLDLRSVRLASTTTLLRSNPQLFASPSTFTIRATPLPHRQLNSFGRGRTPLPSCSLLFPVAILGLVRPVRYPTTTLSFLLPTFLLPMTVALP